VILRAWKENANPSGAGDGSSLPHRVGVAAPAAAAMPPMYALGNQREASDFAARNHIASACRSGPFARDGARWTGYYKRRMRAPRLHGGAAPDHIRANILIAETDEKAQAGAGTVSEGGRVPVKAGGRRGTVGVTSALSPARGGRPAHVNRVLRSIFCGGPDEIGATIEAVREQIGAGVVDLVVPTPGLGNHVLTRLMEALELFGKNVLPHSGI